MFQCRNPDHKSCSYEIVEYRNKAVVFCYHDCWIADIPPKRERERLEKIAAEEAREQAAILEEIAICDWRKAAEDQNKADQVDKFGDSRPR